MKLIGHSEHWTPLEVLRGEMLDAHYRSRDSFDFLTLQHFEVFEAEKTTASAGLATLANPTRCHAEARPVWIDTDPACGVSDTSDVDDCWALLYALRSPERRGRDDARSRKAIGFGVYDSAVADSDLRRSREEERGGSGTVNSSKRCDLLSAQAGAAPHQRHRPDPRPTHRS